MTGFYAELAAEIKNLGNAFSAAYDRQNAWISRENAKMRRALKDPPLSSRSALVARVRPYVRSERWMFGTAAECEAQVEAMLGRTGA